MVEDLSRNSEVLPTLGYLLTAYDGGRNTFQYWGDNPIPGVHCPACYSPIDQDAVSTQIDVRGRLEAYSLQGHLVVSERFRDFILKSGYHDVELPCVDARRRLYEVRPTRVLKVDIEKSEPLLSDFCVKCGNFECYVRGRGVFLYNSGRSLKKGIYRTDLLVGCHMGKHFDVIVAPETKEKIIAAKFGRLRFRPLPDLDPEFEWRKSTQVEVAAEMRKKDRAYDRLHRLRVRRGLARPAQVGRRLFKV